MNNDDRLDVRPRADIYIFPWSLLSESGSGVSVHLGVRILTSLTLVFKISTHITHTHPKVKPEAASKLRTH